MIIYYMRLLGNGIWTQACKKLQQPVKISETVFEHDLHQDPEGLLLGHLEQQRGDEEALALAVADLRVIDRVGLADPVQSLLAPTSRFLDNENEGYDHDVNTICNLP